MLKYEFANADKSIIRHNLVPEMLIEVIKLNRPNDYEDIDIWSDIFDEKTIKGWHFVFRVLNDYDFQDVEDYSRIRSILKRASKWYQAKVAMGEIELNRYTHEPSPLEDDDFKLTKTDRPDWWLLAHKESSIIIEFQEGNFNETQKIAELSPSLPDFMQYARVMRLCGEWLVLNHPDKI